MKKELLVVLLLLFLSFPAVKELLQPGGFTSHDLTHHIVRQIDMDRLLSEGQFPPRWSGELNNGFGYPLFLFNYPFPAMLGEVFHKLGFNFLWSVKMVLIVSLPLSALGMYLFLRTLLGSASYLSALICGMFYLYAPIRFLNVYVSAALGNSLALVWVPFIFWSIVKLKKPSWLFFLIGSLSTALLITTHNVTTLLFGPFLVVFAFLFAFQSKDRIGVLRRVFGMLLLGAGLAAFFWIPATFEKQFIQYDLVLPRAWADQFPEFWQLIRSPWGYGFSKPGPEDGISFQIGLIHLTVIALLMLLWWFTRKKRNRWIAGFSLIGFVASVFLMLSISTPLWDNLPLLEYVLFPARYLAVSIFCASIAASLVVKYLPAKHLVVGILLALVLFANRNHWHTNQVYDPGENYYLSLKTTGTSYAEALPVWGQTLDYESPGKFMFIEGDGEITLNKNTSARVQGTIEVTEPAVIRFNQVYFPGWTIEVAGKPIKFDYLQEGEHRGFPVFELPSGSHHIVVEFKETLIRSLADTFSLGGAAIWLALFVHFLLIRKDLPRKSTSSYNVR